MAGNIEKISKVARSGNSLGFRIPQEGVERPLSSRRVCR